jgi:hypothetical protein
MTRDFSMIFYKVIVIYDDLSFNREETKIFVLFFFHIYDLV